MLDQSIRPSQIIVIDDFSSDATPRILERLQLKYSNLKVIRNSENLGKAASVTNALDHITAAHTAVVDSDTYLNKNYLFQLLVHSRRMWSALTVWLCLQTQTVW